MLLEPFNVFFLYGIFMKNYSCYKRWSIPLLLFLVLFIGGRTQALAVPSITILTPATGGDWCRGTHYNITWRSSDITNMKIELSSDGGTTYPTVLVSSTPATTGTWSWLVPSGQASGTQYRFRVSDVTNASVHAESAIVNISPLTAITAHPQSYTEPVCDGVPATITFSVSATGYNLRYQWQHDGNAIDGATARTYTIATPLAWQAGSYNVVVTGVCDEVVSSAATLVVYSKTELGNSPDDEHAHPVQQIVCEGTPAQFSITARGTDLTYQWRKNGVPVQGATEAQYAIDASDIIHAGNYDVVVRGACGSVTSKSAQLVVNPATGINRQPQPQTVCADVSVVFEVEATGASLSYQWRRNKTNIDGATAPTYTIGSATVSATGDYDVVVSGCPNSIVTSNSVALIVNEVTAIVAHPADKQVCSGMPVELAVTATGANLTYQWRRNGEAIQGAITPRYAIAATTTDDAGSYDVVVQGICGAETSAAASVTVYPTTLITQQPASIAVCEDTPATFSVEAAGADLTYQWRYNGVAIAGATQAQYTTSASRLADAGDYDVVISIASSNCGTIVSKPATLRVHGRPKIAAPLGIYTVCLGSPVTISVEATGKDSMYQWRKNGEVIKGATESSYTINAVRQEDLGNYDVVVQGLCTPTVTSNMAEVKLAETPVFTVQPVSQTVCEDAAVILHAAATYAAQYTWYKNGVAIPQATDERYTLTSVDARAEGDYTCVVTGRCNQTITSSSAHLTVTPKPIIHQQPSSVTAKVDEPVLLSVVATGNNLVYQWRKNGASVAGATSSQFLIEKAKKSDEGVYSVAIQGECKTVVSAVAFVIVTTGTAQAPVFTLSSVQLIYGTVDIGKQSELEFTASNTGGGTITMSEIVLEGADAAEFGISTMPSLPHNLTATDNPLALRVVFTPTTVGDKKADIVIKSNGVNIGTIQLLGSGRSINSGSPKLTSVSGESINFGVLELPDNTSKSMEVKVKNTGTAVAKITEAVLAGPQAGAFSIASTIPTLPAELPSDSEMTIVVEYKPTTTGTAKAALSVTAESISMSLTIQLIGTATQKTVSVSERNVAVVFAVAPNPATDMAMIRFAFRQPFAAVQVYIVDAFGRQVRHLGVFTNPTAEQRVQWDGRDDSGYPCASGVYRVVLASDSALQSLPVSIVR